MGSGVPKGAVVNRDLEGLHITPGNLGLGGERQSMVDVDQTLVIVAPDGVRVGVLIQKNQSVAKLQLLPAASGKLSARGLDCVLAGEATTFSSGVSSNGSPFSVPEIAVAVTEWISQVRLGCAEATP